MAAQTVAIESVKSETTDTTTVNPTAVTAAIIPQEPIAKLHTSSVCLLKICTEANILFDEGAQQSFMSNQLLENSESLPNVLKALIFLPLEQSLHRPDNWDRLKLM